MILSKYVQVVDISWEEFLWMAFWFFVIAMIIGAAIWSTAWIASRTTFIKNVLPKKMDGLIGRLENKIKVLERELVEVRLERDQYYDRLLVISTSAAVRGDKLRSQIQKSDHAKIKPGEKI